MITSFPYRLLDCISLRECMNTYGVEKTPFLFIVDFHASKGYVIPKDDIDADFVRFQFPSTTLEHDVAYPAEVLLDKDPLPFNLYEKRFQYVQDQISQGNSFLTNLTFPTEIKSNLSLAEIFQYGKAKYKLWLNNQFTVLSPETFVTIHDGYISSFPMKGTIDASIPDAKSKILADEKEMAEHATIVDLIRNDLSMVADDVAVVRYRYVDQLYTHNGSLLQVSSEIRGKLSETHQSQLGDIIFQLLPAGSICGAPKPKTLEIIAEAEGYDRGFYTGVCGYFDGKSLDSAVMIRFVEQQGNRLYFKSGGGITSQSNALQEYEELIKKVYVPIY